MKITSSYKVKIKHYNKIFEQTVEIYRHAVSFFLDICSKEWETLTSVEYKKLQVPMMERLTLATNSNPEPKYHFNAHFYKMPCYLRRAARQEAMGCYSSYLSNLMNWEETKQGKAPTLQSDRYVMPAFYKGNMYKRISEHRAKIKIYYQKDWVWLDVVLNRQDVKYIQKHCSNKTKCVPTLKRKGKCWYLVFAFTEKVALNETKIEEQRICAVDLGLNHNAVCSVMHADGTVSARQFIDLAVEKDHLHKALGRIKQAQKQGASKTPVLWQHANNLNKDISQKTAKEIIRFAIANKVDVIVFEYLDTQGKKKGSKKQGLALWRKKEIQRIVEHHAHMNGMRIRRICAWNTSRLAYDGSGRVQRGIYLQNGKERYNYSVCTFPSGKQYNCDLNATYNIGARYFIRELLKTNSVMRRLPSQTKDSDYGTGSTRTLSTLFRLNADLCSFVA